MHNIFEFTPNLIGILGSASFTNFKLQKKIKDLSESNYSLIGVNDVFILETSIPWNDLSILEKNKAFKLLNGKNKKINFDNDIVVAPKKGIQSPWSSKVNDIFKKCGIDIKNIEKVNCFTFSEDMNLNSLDLMLLHDPLVERVINDIEQIKYLFTANVKKDSIEINGAARENFSNINQTLSLGLNDFEINYLFEGLKTTKRRIKDSELMMFSQINSEHCRHKIFNSRWTNHSQEKEYPSLFSMIKDTYENYSENVLSAYSDNAAVIKGKGSSRFFPDPISKNYKYQNEQNNFCIKVETHNHPTAIAPFPGAATGSGGEIRDEGATGIGAKRRKI